MLGREASLAQKQDYLGRVLATWSDRLLPVSSVEEPARLHYRERVTLSAAHDASGGWRFGLMLRDELLPIHDCPVHAPHIRALVRHLARSLPPPATLPLAFLHVAGGQATLIVKARQVAALALGDALEGLAETGIDGLWLHFHPSAGRRLFARSGWQLAWGRPESRDALGLLHGPTAFLQPLAALQRDSLDVAAAHLRITPGASVLDLYCGHGTTLQRWCQSGARVLGVELSGDAVRDAARNAPSATILRGRCADRLPQVREWWARRCGPGLAYANPPRSGLEPELARALALELRPARLAYLSCSGGTLARDLGIFAAAGYEVTTLRPYDFFPQTHHVEVLALLDLPA
jgi:23S rRNA (uracil1939-C5)-methyltransferase